MPALGLVPAATLLRHPGGPESIGPRNVLAMRISEGMNGLAAAAIDWPLFNARGDKVRRGWARAGVAALREFCRTERGNGESGSPFGASICSRLAPKLDALERTASGAPEAIRAAARDVIELASTLRLRPRQCLWGLVPPRSSDGQPLHPIYPQTFKP